MSRRSGIPHLLLLSTVWAWLVFSVVCGATAPRFLEQIAPAPADGCCQRAADPDTCATPGCGLTCAALLTAVVSEGGVDLMPAVTVQRFADVAEFAATVSRCPPVPPPKGAAAV